MYAVTRYQTRLEFGFRCPSLHPSVRPSLLGPYSLLYGVVAVNLGSTATVAEIFQLGRGEAAAAAATAAARASVVKMTVAYAFVALSPLPGVDPATEQRRRRRSNAKNSLTRRTGEGEN